MVLSSSVSAMESCVESDRNDVRPGLGIFWSSIIKYRLRCLHKNDLWYLPASCPEWVQIYPWTGTHRPAVGRLWSEARGSVSVGRAAQEISGAANELAPDKGSRRDRHERWC